MPLQQWLGRLLIDSSNDSFSIATNPFTLTGGYYFIAGYTGESAVQLCERITAAIIGTYANAAVTYSEVTGLVTFKIANSGSYTITWTDTALQALLGFTGTQSGGYTYTATMEPKFVWRPDVAMSDAPVDCSRVVQPISSTRVYVSRDGTDTTVRGNTRYGGEVAYQLLAGARVFIPSTGSVNRELETFFTDVIAAGEPIRLYPDRTLNASTSFVNVKVTGGEEIGAFESFARKRITSYQGLADVRIPLAKHLT